MLDVIKLLAYLVIFVFSVFLLIRLVVRLVQRASASKLAQRIRINLKKWDNLHIPWSMDQVQLYKKLHDVRRLAEFEEAKALLQEALLISDKQDNSSKSSEIVKKAILSEFFNIPVTWCSKWPKRKDVVDILDSGKFHLARMEGVICDLEVTFPDFLKKYQNNLNYQIAEFEVIKNSIEGSGYDIGIFMPGFRF